MQPDSLLCNIPLYRLSKCLLKIFVPSDWKPLKDISFYFTKTFRYQIKKKKATYLFKSVRKKPYSDRGIRKIMQKYTEEAGIEHSISPHKLRHFLSLG